MGRAQISAMWSVRSSSSTMPVGAELVDGAQVTSHAVTSSAV
jgi:hypothetical protein